MAIGDDAAAAGMALVNGALVPARDIDDEINRTRDYIANERAARTAADAQKVTLPADGGLMARREPGSVHNIGFYTPSTPHCSSDPMRPPASSTGAY